MVIIKVNVNRITHPLTHSNPEIYDNQVAFIGFCRGLVLVRENTQPLAKNSAAADLTINKALGWEACVVLTVGFFDE